MVWRTEQSERGQGYEPGAHDPATSQAIVDHLIIAEDAAPPKSELKRQLGRRYEYILASAVVQEEFREYKRPWWESWSHPSLSALQPDVGGSRGCKSNGTLSLTGRINSGYSADGGNTAES